MFKLPCSEYRAISSGRRLTMFSLAVTLTKVAAYLPHFVLLWLGLDVGHMEYFWVYATIRAYKLRVTDDRRIY